MRHRKIKRPLVPALVFTVAGVLTGLMHAPLPQVLLPAAALGGIWLLPMLSGRNKADKSSLNVINIIIQGAVAIALKRAIAMGRIIVMIRIMAIEKAVVMEKIVITMEACIFSYSYFSYYFWLVLSQHISMKIMTIKYLVKNYSVKSYLRRKKQNMAVV